MLNENDIQDMATAEPVQETAQQEYVCRMIFDFDEKNDGFKPFFPLYEKPSPALIKKWKALGVRFEDIPQAKI